MNIRPLSKNTCRDDPFNYQFNDKLPANVFELNLINFFEYQPRPVRYFFWEKPNDFSLILTDKHPSTNTTQFHRSRVPQQ